MATIFGNLDVAGLEHQTADPVTFLFKGRLYYNTTSNSARIYNGTVWTDTLDGVTAQVVTLKDIDGGTASNTSRITVPKDSTTNINALTRKQGTLLYDTTANTLKYDDGTNLNTVATSSTLQDSPLDLKNYSISCSVSSNALTIALKDKGGSNPSGGSPVSIGFRNATVATGDYSVVTATSALSIVVSSGSTLGHPDNVSSYIYVYALNNAGAIELAVSSTRFDEGVVYSSTAEGGAGAADSFSVLYSTTARTSKAVRLLARLKSTQTTAGTWGNAPSEVSLQQLGLLNVPTSQVRINTGSSPSHGSTNTKIRRFDIIVNIGSGITAVDSNTLGTSITINEAGVYSFSYSDNRNATGGDIGLSLNSVNLTTSIGSLNATERIIMASQSSSVGIANVSATIRLAAGDVVRAHTDGAMNSTSNVVQLVATQVCKL